MIKAKFTGPSGQVFKTKLPSHSLSLASELSKIGLKAPLHFVKLADDSSQMQFTPKNNVASRLFETFSRDGTLEDLNDAALAVCGAHKLIKEQLKENILNDHYSSLQSLLNGIHQLTYDAGSVSETYYFPLSGKIWDDECPEGMEVSDRFLAAYSENIQEHFAVYMSGDTENMASYFHGAGADKLLLADWGFDLLDDTLYGKVDVRLTEPMTEKESSALKDWIRGQNSDGLGEGYEQREILTNEGELTVSFWHSGGDYFVYTRNEMEENMQNSFAMEFGGM